MEELIQYLKTTQLEGLKGTSITVELSLSEQQLNELIEQFVRPRLQTSPSTATSSGTESSSSGSIAEWIPLLRFPVMKVKISGDKLILDLKVEV